MDYVGHRREFFHMLASDAAKSFFSEMTFCMDATALQVGL